MRRQHGFTVRVYYEDTDFSGNVYHAAYLRFMERGRTEFLREAGISHAELQKDGIAFAVRSMNIDFRAAAHIDDLLTVTTELVEATGARMILDQSVQRDALGLVFARVTVVAINASGRARRLPAGLATRFMGE